MSLRHAAVFALSALAAACGRVDNPFASFETHCASLPSSEFQVVTKPLTFERDDTRPIAELTVMSGSALAAHQTMGLTTAVFGQSADIDLHVIDDHRGSRACGTPRIRVELSMQPVTVFIARELAQAPCQHDVTLSHEMKHVAVFREVLDEAARALEHDFPEAIGAELRRAASPDELQRRLIVGLRDYLARFMSDWQRELDARQAEVHSPEEYARVSTTCAHQQDSLLQPGPRDGRKALAHESVSRQ